MLKWRKIPTYETLNFKNDELLFDILRSVFGVNPSDNKTITLTTLDLEVLKAVASVYEVMTTFNKPVPDNERGKARVYYATTDNPFWVIFNLVHNNKEITLTKG